VPGKSRRSRNDSKRAARTPTRAGAARPSTSAITTAGSAASGDLKQHGTLFLVLAVMALVALVRLRVADVPLERDEGEYAYAGQLILQGIPPYQLAWNMKFPGTYYAYSLIMSVFGQTAWGIHAGLIIVNGASTTSVRNNLEIMVDEWIGRGLPANRLFLTTIPPRRPGAESATIPDLNNKIRALASAKGVRLIDIAAFVSNDNGLTWKSTSMHLVNDQLHYSEAVRDWIADQVVSVMLALNP
jgi:hypothetical protein